MIKCEDIRKNASNLPSCYDFDGTEYENCLICPYHLSNETFMRITKSRRKENKICEELEEHYDRIQTN